MRKFVLFEDFFVTGFFFTFLKFQRGVLKLILSTFLTRLEVWHQVKTTKESCQAKSTRRVGSQPTSDTLAFQ